MVGRKRTAGATRSSARRRGAAADADEPDIYSQMLAEAGVGSVTREPTTPERPLKRRRPESTAKANLSATEANSGLPQRAGVVRGESPEKQTGIRALGHGVDEDEDEDEDEDVEFQDVVIPPATVQTMERESEDDDDDEEDIQFEDVDFTTPLKETNDTADRPGEIELNLTAHAATTPTKKQDRRRPITKEEKDRRIAIHKMHLLCLLSHVARRNHWCNDPRVQDSLRPHLTDKTVNYLTPGPSLSQFGRAESLKNGLQQAAEMWKTKFEVTERGTRRALWAEEIQHLEQYELPNDMETCLDRADFREAAKKLQGSRDIGAQLYCALLRSAGVRARLVCSLQPLGLVNGPTLPKPRDKATPTKGKANGSSKKQQVRAAVDSYRELVNASSSTTSSPSTARRRLGHPAATAYNFSPSAGPSMPPPTFAAPKQIRESSYPVYWVEVLDVGHQKWQPADPVVTHTFWKPRNMEPPITDKENCMSYVVAFDADGTARDVTRRYAKAYTAKTRKLRVDGITEGGERWWRKALRPYRRRVPEDLDQIEDNELGNIEAREPMPRNVQDFKDHPVYALERHLRRHEVLVPEAVPSGTIAAGSRGALEKIYRKRDVRIARTEDKWFRLGREVKPNEVPAKWLAKRAKPRGRFDDLDDTEDDGLNGVPVYSLDQTELYEPPPVRNGRVPKNKFGNIDAYVPSMIPRGGVHINHEHAARAAFLLGVDYAPALTGFQFKGRQGTAVLSGIVAPAECEEGIWAVIAGLGDVERQAEEERRRALALRQWRRFLMALRIRERVWGGVAEEERREAEREVNERLEKELEEAPSDVTEEFDAEIDEDMGGGFMVD